MNNEPTPLINPLADSIARLIWREIDPQTDSDIDECLERAAAHFTDPILTDITNAIFAIADSDPN